MRHVHHEEPLTRPNSSVAYVKKKVPLGPRPCSPGGLALASLPSNITHTSAHSTTSYTVYNLVLVQMSLNEHVASIISCTGVSGRGIILVNGCEYLEYYSVQHY